jgi:hypothetical protein
VKRAWRRAHRELEIVILFFIVLSETEESKKETVESEEVPFTDLQ